MSFSIGEKVVFIGATGPTNPNCKPPKIGEVVTIEKKSNRYKDSYILLEYPTALNGRVQSFSQITLRKLSEVSGELSEEILNECLTTIEEPIEV